MLLAYANLTLVTVGLAERAILGTKIWNKTTNKAVRIERRKSISLCWRLDVLKLQVEMSWLMSYTDIFIEGNQVTWYYSQSNYDNRVLLTGYRFTKTHMYNVNVRSWFEYTWILNQNQHNFIFTLLSLCWAFVCIVLCDFICLRVNKIKQILLKTTFCF